MTPFTDYLLELHEALRATKVTDALGAPLPLNAGTQQAVELILATRAAGGVAMVVGNGGSAAIASHLHNDLAKAVRLRSLVFTDTALLTALSNDHGYEQAYARQVAAWSTPNDLLIAISSSGKSRNLLHAVNAHRGGTITLTGFAQDNPLRKLGDLNFYVPHSSYGCVELAHGVIAHHLTDAAMAAASPHDESRETRTYDLQIHPDRAGDRRSRLRRRRASA